MKIKKLIPFIISLLTISCMSSNREIGIDSDQRDATVLVNNKEIGQVPQKILIDDNVSSIYVRIDKDNQIITNPINERLNASYLPLTANLPLFVALEKRYFEQYGIKVNATEANSPNDILTGIAAGKVDFAAVLAYSILLPSAYKYKDEFKLYNSSEETPQNYTSSIITLVDSPINTIDDLRGKKIGVYKGLVQKVFLEAMLVGMGVDPNEIEMVEVSPRLQIQGLVSGEYDALSSTEPTINIATIQGIAKIVVENPRVKYILNPFPSTAATISTKLLQDNPKAANGVIMGLNDAIDYINNNPEDAKKILPLYTPIPEENRSEILADIKLFKFSKLGEENRLNVQRFADYLFENSIMNNRIQDVNELFGDYQPLNK